MKKLLAFLMFAAAGALVCAFALTAAYDFFTASNRRTPYGYAQFLLENIAAPRIVIDAGSSSMFGIEPGLIEQAFSIPVIDVADNGSIPLEMKIYRLLATARRGDTLILPFEWVYYTRDLVPQDFTDKTPDEYAAYYASQPFLTRLAFVVQHLSLHNLSDAGRLYMRQDLQSGHAARIRQDMAKWPLGDRKDDSRRRSSVGDTGCADYIAATGRIPPVVDWAAAKLAGLQAQRGVRIYLTWPAVAGSDCYDMANGRLPIADQARAIFQRHGLAVVGEPEDSYFSPEHMLDTYYHVDSRAARLRTQRLIGRLQDAGMTAGAAARPTAVLADEAVRGLP
jgi:hypothetical protein